MQIHRRLNYVKQCSAVQFVNRQLKWLLLQRFIWSARKKKVCKDEEHEKHYKIHEAYSLRMRSCCTDFARAIRIHKLMILMLCDYCCSTNLAGAGRLSLCLTTTDSFPLLVNQTNSCVRDQREVEQKRSNRCEGLQPVNQKLMLKNNLK